jgi:hypothetical protein
MWDRDTLIAYDEYCTDCVYEGKIPVPFHRWLEGEE